MFVYNSCYISKAYLAIFEGGLKSVRPQNEDGSTYQQNLKNVVLKKKNYTFLINSVYKTILCPIFSSALVSRIYKHLDT